MNHVAWRTEANDDEFAMEFDSDDDEGRAAEAKRKRLLSRYTVDKDIPARTLSSPVCSIIDKHFRTLQRTRTTRPRARSAVAYRAAC